ncbi:MAG: hypothetical protein U1E27_14025, partial [Kiritimatiellia bacterium]|nr:hypothetical protein [Kiritimatiellia bacterium]
MLVIPGTALGVAGCISTIRSPDTRHEGQVYLGTLYRGPGLYLVNVPEPTCKSQPHLTLTGVTTNLDITIDVVNGYEKEILLRLPDRKTTETIRIGH